ncbi:TadG family pilus assembly protein [Methylomonas sp. HYX-M1]|uniref:TadG family pilus assembly protein n=1 Tax=Methylomonas sp. HYX-M1 TaxID=3139307 RepID=UPI00345B55D1
MGFALNAKRDGRFGFRSQRGNIGFYGTLALMSALLFMVLAVDTGRIAWEKQRLQRIADLSALHAASVAVCGGTEQPSQALVAAAAQTVAAANGYGGNLTNTAGAVTLGSTQTVSGNRQFNTVANAADADAVQVVATSQFPGSLILGGFGNTQLSATAVATKQVLAGFRLGSFLARVDTGDSILNPLLGGMLGSALALDLVGYKGIAAAQVSLLDLINATAGVGTVNELLAADLGVGEFIDIVAQAVGPNTTAGLALNQMSLAAIAGLPTIRLGDILAVTGDNPEAALDAQLNALDIVTAAVQLANKEHAISVPAFGVDLAPIATVALNLYIVEAPKIAIGPPGKNSDGSWRTEVSTAQLRLQLDVSLLNLSVLGILNTSINLNLYLDVAKAKAHLTSVKCATSNNRKHEVVVGVTPSVITLGIGQYSNIAGGSATTASPTIMVKLGSLDAVKLTISAAAAVANPNATDLTFEVSSTPISVPPPNSLTQTAHSDAAAGLANAISDLVASLQLTPTLLGLSLLDLLLVQPLLSLIAPAIEAILTPVFTTIGTAILDPLLTALGIQLGGADVTLLWLDATNTTLAI